MLDECIGTLIDCTFETFKAVYKLIDNMINDNENVITKKQWEEFLQSINICNKSKEIIKYSSTKDNTITFYVPYGISEEDIKPKEVYFKKFLNCNRVEYTIKRNYMVMNYYVESLPEKIKYDINNEIVLNKNTIEIDIGQSYNGITKINFNKMPHLLIAGATGSGKSVMTHCILTQLYRKYRNIDFYLADMKKVELINYKNKECTKRYVDSIEEVSDLIEELLEECNRRYELIAKAGCKKIETYNKKVNPKDRMNNIIFVIEECVRLVSDKNIQKNLAELLFIARACGIYVICTIQRPTVKCISPEIKSSLGNIIGMKTVNKRNSEVICDDNRLKDLRGHGHCWVFNDEGEIETQGFYIDEDEIDTLLKDVK